MPVARLRSIGQTLAATLGVLRDADVDLASLDDHGARGADLSVLARRFDEQLSQADLVDRSALFRLAARSAQGDVAMPISGPLLLLDVAVRDDVTRRLVQALCGRASHSLATVPDGDERSLWALNESLVRTRCPHRHVPARPISSTVFAGICSRQSVYRSRALDQRVTRRSGSSRRRGRIASA